jgi:hypothetical protein
MSPVRILVPLLAAMALAAPAAYAQPAGYPRVPAPHQDLRSPDAIDAARQNDAASRPLPEPPTWPSDPQPISTPAAASDDGGGIDAPTIALGILGSLIGVVAVTGIAGRSRRGKHRHAAV